MESRIQKAVLNFKEGYNCSQAVALAFSDIYHIESTMMARMALPFGGGIGRMRCTCGAACGMFLLTGLEKENFNPKNANDKMGNYKLVQALAEKFKQANGALTCSELLAMRKNKDLQNKTAPSCDKIVENTARIFAQYLLSKEKNVSEQ